jgi:cytidyltransferase-like protein
VPNNKRVLVSGRFNVLHSGHLRLLRFAKESGYKLIVAVESDRIAGKHAHILQNLRLEGIQSVSWVDEAFIYDEPINLLIKRIRPDIVVKGKEHELANNPEAKELKVYGGQLKFSSGETIFSSLDLIKKEFEFYDSKSIELPTAYLDRHLINKKQLLIIIQKFSNLKICVVGDLIIDEYITCEPLGMSQEDPTIVVTPLDYSRFVGGAGIVAAHAAGLGAKVNFISVTGDDTSRKFALEELSKSGVDKILFIDNKMIVGLFIYV